MIPVGGPLYLDCDTGIDDALALAFLLGAGHPPDLVGTVSGNVSATVAADNTRRILALFGHSDIPVAVGCDYPPLLGHPRGAPQFHGANGIGGVTLAPARTPPPPTAGAVEEMITLAQRHRGALHIIATGPLTNIAEALRREPDLPDAIASITVMGGAAHVPGNVTPYAEANILGDPEAAAATFTARWHQLLLVPIDITNKHLLSVADKQRLLHSPSAAIRSVGMMLDWYFDSYGPVHAGLWCPTHDPLAAALAVGAVELTDAPTVTITVDTSMGPQRGRMTVRAVARSDIAPFVRVALGTRQQSADTIIDAVCGLAGTG
ncbi:nucleoside hydrolase [Williamsia sp. 1135]|uniref:nucleoside hydrolase n=1 Tax=Williamsia sp. 1135 TaxID=1889262 RepID=UPI000A100038|nr:nucleoside hydrolase [Williamsia sp. 1135]ORM36198.1 hypothetical protein BFL43_07650 [Williamsia sp. 1135]